MRRETFHGKHRLRPGLRGFSLQTRNSQPCKVIHMPRMLKRRYLIDVCEDKCGDKPFVFVRLFMSDSPGRFERMLRVPGRFKITKATPRQLANIRRAQILVLETELEDLRRRSEELTEMLRREKVSTPTDAPRRTAR